MFLRIKKIKNKEYAYLVDNKWDKRKNSSRQKTKKYLGRSYKLPKDSPSSFFEFLKQDPDTYLDSNSPSTIIKDLVKHELTQHNFNLKDQSWTNEKFTINLENLQVTDGKTQRNISLEMNEGFLNNYTLTNLFNFSFPEGDQKQMATSLANTLLASGLSIDQDIFIELFTKLSEENKQRQESLK